MVNKKFKGSEIFRQERSSSATIYATRPGCIIASTHNYAKFSELWDYVKAQRTPIPFPEESNKMMNRFGFASSTINATSPRPHLHDLHGFFLGAVMFFYKQWFESSTQDIQQIAAYFKGGVPIQGAHLQEIYSILSVNTEAENIVSFKRLVTNIVKFIHTYPRKPEVQFNTFIPQEKALFKGVKAFLDAGHRPEDGKMEEWVQDWVMINEKIQLKGGFYASLREASICFDLITLKHEKDFYYALFSIAGLRIETLKFNDTADEILKEVETLSPGAYNLRLPVLSSQEQLAAHAIAFIVQEEGPSYFYDPNACIAQVKRDEVPQTIRGLLEYYSQFGYSPSAPCDEIDLYKVYPQT